MGRGRAKAKQTKVARELKYSTGNLDPERLKAELAGQPATRVSAPVEDDADEVDGDPYASYVDDDDATAR